MCGTCLLCAACVGPVHCVLPVWDLSTVCCLCGTCLLCAACVGPVHCVLPVWDLSTVCCLYTAVWSDVLLTLHYTTVHLHITLNISVTARNIHYPVTGKLKTENTQSPGYQKPRIPKTQNIQNPDYSKLGIFKTQNTQNPAYLKHRIPKTQNTQTPEYPISVRLNLILISWINNIRSLVRMTFRSNNKLQVVIDYSLIIDHWFILVPGSNIAVVHSASNRPLYPTYRGLFWVSRVLGIPGFGYFGYPRVWVFRYGI